MIKGEIMHYSHEATSPTNPNWPSKVPGKTSGPHRGNNPPNKK